MIPEIKLNCGCGNKPLVGFINLDKKGEQFKVITWAWEDLFPWIMTNSVDAITESSSLYYVKIEDYPMVMKEIYRILKPKGILRITEHNTENPESKYYDGHSIRGSVLHLGLTYTPMGPKMMRNELERVGFKVYDVNSDFTNYKDKSLIQKWFDEPPHYFYMEGIKL